MPKMEHNGNYLAEFIHSVNFDPVTARYVKYEIKEIVPYNDIKDEGSEHTAHINEIAVCNYAENGDVTIYPIRVFGDNATSLTYSIEKEVEDVVQTLTYGYNSVNASISINNDSNQNKSYKIFAAQYKADGTLVALESKNVTVAANKNIIENVTLKLNSSLKVAETAASKITFMVWDGTTLAPCCQSVGMPELN